MGGEGKILIEDPGCEKAGNVKGPLEGVIVDPKAGDPRRAGPGTEPRDPVFSAPISS